MSALTASRRATVERGTGLTWEQICGVLDPHRDEEHSLLAERILTVIRDEGASSNPEWWAQMATVAYEQHIGRRTVGERSDGTFSVNVSKTLPGTMDEVLGRLDAAGAGRTEFAGIPIESAPTTSATDAWRYWRVRLADGSRVTATIQTKPGREKSTVGVNHDRLPHNDDAEALKSWWREFLTSL